MNYFAASQPFSWQAQIVQRLKSDWLLKALGTSVFMAVFFYAYFAVLRAPAYPVSIMPTTVVDEAIVFWPSAFYIYASLWVYTSLVPALQPNFYRLTVYGWGIGFVCLTGLAFFYFLPTTLPFSSADWFSDPRMKVLRELDMAGNACPSLHVASSMFTAMCMQRQLSSMACPKWLHALNWIWCVLIVYSTMAIKQHVMWDVVAGLALGVICAWLYQKFEARVLRK